MKIDLLKKCTLCPNNCKINRLENSQGKCHTGKEIKIALTSLHMYEEPCISGKNGSGTIFFSNCNLECVFCQNYKISQQGKGEIITTSNLAKKFIDLQNQGANNINLVTPTPYVVQIIETIEIAKSMGLKIPIIYNCGGYENIDTLKILNGYIDVYLPDFKYSNNELGYKYSKIKNYFQSTILAIKEMYNQVGAPILDHNGIIQKGLIIRHLILPNEIENTKNVLKWINENIDKNVFVSIMAQYFPTNKVKKYCNLNRKITKNEYKEIETFLYSLNIDNGYIQDLEDNEEIYVPSF